MDSGVGVGLQKLRRGTVSELRRPGGWASGGLPSRWARCRRNLTLLHRVLGNAAAVAAWGGRLGQ